MGFDGLSCRLSCFSSYYSLFSVKIFAKKQLLVITLAELTTMNYNQFFVKPSDGLPVIASVCLWIKIVDSQILVSKKSSANCRKRHK